MRKIFLLLFFTFLNISFTFAYTKPEIISREEWWANEEFLYIDSQEWKQIIEKNNKEESKPKTEAQKQKDIKERIRKIQINNILFVKHKDKNEVSHKQEFLNWRELAWPIEYSSKIRWIVVHHTETSYKSSIEWVKAIYKYHALTKQWWDIGYNFLIWEDWEIYEWRAGWEKAVWAHARFNNIWTIWISLIWSYQNKYINNAQYNSLQNLIWYLVEKYNIDLKNNTTFFKNCVWVNCFEPLEVKNIPVIVWHRDVWNTTCPWDKLYSQMQEIRTKLFNSVPNKLKPNFNPDFVKPVVKIDDKEKEKFFKIFDKLWEKKLLEVMVKIEEILEKKFDKKVYDLKNYIIEYFKEKENFQVSNKTDKEIKIKLSYPEEKNILTITDGIVEKKLEIIDGKLFVDSVETEKFFMKNSINPYLEITSWDRINSWDYEKKYKDNRFRWEIQVYLKDSKFVVVNILKIEDYLKWLWEISDSENIEKAKAIIISARTYALWYTEKDRKFIWEFYDWSDDPEIFQKYIWYDLEQRSPNLNKIVDETKWIVLNYNSELIKPWYFSSSTWKTLSFYDFCIKSKLNSSDFCLKEKEKYPYLQSKIDLWWIWKKQSWHGVWLSWTWATYFSSKWWTFSMILKYFYEWIEIK